MSSKTHFRKVLKSDHLGTSDLEDFIEEGRSLIFTIKEVRQQYGVSVAGKKGDFNIAYFAELCVIEWAKAIKRPDIAKVATQIFSGSSTATFKNADLYAKANPNGVVKISKMPLANSVAIYRYGYGWQGHTAIVQSVASVPPAMRVTNIEGNTNDVGGREGYIVARKTRNHYAPNSEKGLNIVGYIQFV